MKFFEDTHESIIDQEAFDNVQRIRELEILIAKIYEDNALGKLSDKRYTTQKIEIYFNFIGEYIPPTMAEKEPTPEELEE